MVDYLNPLIGGDRVNPSTDRKCAVYSPGVASFVGRASLASSTDIDLAVLSAKTAFEDEGWKKLGLRGRTQIIERFCDLYAQQIPFLASLVSKENGIPLQSNLALMRELPGQIEAYVEASKHFEWSQKTVQSTGTTTILDNQPSGVVAAFVPWCAPQNFVIAWLVPALLMGCSVVIALPPEAALDVQIIGDLLVEAGVWEGSISILVLENQESEYLAAHPGVDKLAIAGPIESGRRLAAIGASHVKRLLLNFGGSSPAIILPDADLELAVEGLVHRSFFANGEWPDCLSKLIVPRKVQAEFVDAFVRMTGNLSIGDPSSLDTSLGPLVSLERKRHYLECVRMGIEEGATFCEVGSQQPKVGDYVKPAVFSNVSRKMGLSQNMMPGPIVSILPYSDLNEAISISNDSRYGMVGSVWTSDEKLGAAIAGQMRVGNVTVNGAWNEPGSPFGGFKQSGLGRVFGLDGLREFLETKVVAF